MARCRDCGALVVWAHLRNGSAVCLDARWVDGIPRPVLTADGTLRQVHDLAYGAGAGGLVVEVTGANGTPRWRAHRVSCEGRAR